MSEERFVDLESRLAHQDQLLHELNDVVTDQQAQLLQLQELCKALIERIQTLAEGAHSSDPADERPPHY